MKQKLEKMYSENGIYDVSLMNDCKYCNSCWQNLTDEQKIGSDRKLYLPYIGEQYEEARVLFVGINMNDYGGVNAAIKLAESAIQEISIGKIRTFVNPEKGYIGSLLWHRIFSYATFVLREINILPKPDDKPYPSIPEMQLAFEYLAMTNSVKCSPNGDRSKPTSQMWNNCPTFILKEEIKILKPKHLIILGNENYNRIKSLFSINDILQDGYVKRIKAQFESEDLTIYVIPHPSSPIGAAIARQDELEGILEQNF